MPVSFAPVSQNALRLTGGPAQTLGAIAGGSGYVNGTYNNVPLTGGSGSGALANVTVAGGAVTAVTLVFGGGRFTSGGASGYLVGDVLSAAASSLGGAGSGFSVPVVTIASYAWLVPANLSLLFLNASAGGGGGGGGQAASGAGGGGGGGGPAWCGFPLVVTPGSVLTITIPMGGLGGAIGAAGTQGGNLIIAGAVSALPATGLPGGFGGAPGATGTGGTGGQGNVNFGGGAGGAAGTAGTTTTLRNPQTLGGGGGGGGGSSASNPAAGGAGSLFGPGITFNGNGNGGGGGSAAWGQGGSGGNLGAGGAPTVGFGGGGGGGAFNFPGAPGGNGFLDIVTA